jgi:L-ascorbate metabolism protein UlaG (beta-lactamase superfamily)
VSILAVTTLPSCYFARVTARNIPQYFKTPDPAPRHDPPADAGAKLAVLWVGHATVLIQMYDKYVLTDPVFTGTVGKLSRRLVQPGLDPKALPDITVTLVSHRHFDHLSRDTFPLIARRTHQVITPVGAAADIPKGPYGVRELAYGDTVEVDGMLITALVVAHDGGRYRFDKASHPVAFTGYVIRYRDLAVYFPGDTAYHTELFTLSRALFPHIDLALLPICPMRPRAIVQTQHMDPHEALLAFDDLGAKTMVPIHFGTFIHSDDGRYDCAHTFDAAIADKGLRDRAFRIVIGENRRIISR